MVSHHDPASHADRAKVLLRAHQLRQEIAEEAHRVGGALAAARALRAELAGLAERIAAAHDDRSQLCDRLAGQPLFASDYWPSQAARARRIAAVERQVAACYRHDQTPSSGILRAATDGVLSPGGSPPG